MDSTIPNSNTSKNLDADGNILYPSVYEFREFIMINKYGQKENITQLVTSFIVSEEIFSPILTAKIVIRDNENFFEDFKIDGQEIIKVKVDYLLNPEDRTSLKTLSYQFVVTDYPLFEKTTESINVQEYELNLISSFAYLSRLQQISQSIVGDPVIAIQKIFENYLAYPKFDYQSKERHPCLTHNLKAVITQRTPLQAVEYLKGLCYDSEDSPFFIYTTLQNDSIIARSWIDIISQDDIYKPSSTADSYQYKPFIEEEVGTTENLRELRSKIISLSSDISLDKLSQAVAGGTGSVIEEIDLARRSYNEFKEFSPKTRIIDQAKNVNGEDKGSSEFDFNYLQNLDFVNGQSKSLIKNILSDPTTSRKVYYLSNDPYPSYSIDPISGDLIKGKSFISPARVKRNALPKARKYIANMESTAHEIGVYGDPNLSAAKKIKIEIPKAIDPSKYNAAGPLDESLSGVYVIAVSIHIFENGIYTNKLRIIKDSHLPSGEIVAMNTRDIKFDQLYG